MNKYRYICQKQRLFNEYIGKYTTYGIVLDGNSTVRINDVCCDRNFVSKIVTALNLCQVQPENLQCVVELML